MTLICGTSDLGRMKSITIWMLDTVSSHQPSMCLMTNKTKKLIDQATVLGMGRSNCSTGLYERLERQLCAYSNVDSSNRGQDASLYLG
eukprot:scaffold4179_cov173-Cylindrotheca_fusiformis.AAC.3